MAIMHLFRAMTAAAILAAWTELGHAQEAIDKAQSSAFDARVFAGNPGKTAYACFVRAYDADHLARHPKQKVAAIKLLMTSEHPPGEEMNYWFRLGVNYRHRRGDFDSSGFCNHALAEDHGAEIRFDCAVDCEGGGINVALSKDNKSAIIRLQAIKVWQNNKVDDDAGEALTAGADDRIFRLDRADTRDCASLVTDRKELAALRHK
jgi:hypothetical protein